VSWATVSTVLCLVVPAISATFMHKPFCMCFVNSIIHMHGDQPHIISVGNRVSIRVCLDEHRHVKPQAFPVSTLSEHAQISFAILSFTLFNIH